MADKGSRVDAVDSVTAIYVFSRDRAACPTRALVNRTAAPASPKVRRARIAELVRKRGHVTVEALADAFDASHETIRRDLTALEEAGAVRKVHGGAKLPVVRDEGPFRERMGRNEAAKRVIAQKVARLVSPGETLFIDTGSTTLICAEETARVPGLTVVTNSPRIAETFATRGESTAVFLIGGRYAPDNAETVGPLAIEGVRAFRADAAIVGAGAVDGEAGVMDVDFEEAQIARAMIDHADRVIVVADATKFDRRAAFAVCPLERVDHLVADRPPTGSLAAALDAASVAVP